ncbi:zinc finger, CCHC-type containing protein [Tanacetum coccineum]
MGDENHIRTLGDYSKPSHEGYRNTIELPEGNNVVPLRSDFIRLVQNRCSFHELRSEDPNEHLKDFLKLVDSLDLDVANKERMRLRSISTWEDLTTHFLAQFFPPGRTAKLRNDILMFQQHQGESLSKAWTHFKDLLQKVPHHGIDLWLQVRIFYDHVNPATRRTIDQSSGGKLCDRNAKDSWELLEDLALFDNKTFVEYASSRTDEAGGKWYTFKPEQNNLGDTYNPSWKIHPNLRWRQPQSSQNKSSNPPNWFQPNGSISNCPFNNNPQSFSNQSNLEGLVSNFMAYQDARLSKFEAVFKQQQSEMTNKIDSVLKVITDQITGALLSDMVKNLKLNVNSTSSVLSARFFPTEDPQCSTRIYSSINVVIICPKQPDESQNNKPEEEE